jgi:hypothetical protein
MRRSQNRLVIEIDVLRIGAADHHGDAHRPMLQDSRRKASLQIRPGLPYFHQAMATRWRAG